MNISTDFLMAELASRMLIILDEIQNGDWGKAATLLNYAKQAKNFPAGWKNRKFIFSADLIIKGLEQSGSNRPSFASTNLNRGASTLAKWCVKKIKSSEIFDGMSRLEVERILAKWGYG